MAKTTVTFELGGQIDIRILADGLKEFHRLVSALTPEKVKIVWIVDDLRASSAVATLRGEADDQADVERVVADYNAVGRALSENEELPAGYSRDVKRVADAIKQMTATVEYVRFETPYDDFTIRSENGTIADSVAPLVSTGTVTGTIQTISNRSGLKFNIYDSIHDRPVSCYLELGQEEIIRTAWGRRATVVGTVSRNSITGFPTSVRNIVAIEPLDDRETNSFRVARGAVPWHPGYPTPEEVIRRLRDA